MIDHRDFAGPEELAAALAAAVAADLGKAIAERGCASMAVSGGSTPERFFAALSEQSVPWDKVSVTLVDERWVPDADPRSNARLVKAHLLRNQAATARFVPLYTGDETPEAGLPEAESAIGAMPSPFAAVILGMGTDGHTASFFPGGDNLRAALGDEAGLLAPMRAPGAGEPRITLSRNTLLQAGALYLHIEGEKKLAVLEQAMAPGRVDEMPVRAMLHQDQTDLVIFYAP